jgi:hypothetical protein
MECPFESDTFFPSISTIENKTNGGQPSNGWKAGKIECANGTTKVGKRENIFVIILTNYN